MAETSSPAAAAPLDGVRVVDLTRILAGPFCSMLLADMGADVIKIEAPGGDPVREQGAIRDGLSWYFATFNRNKRSMRLDLRSEAGRAILAELIERSDVLVENYRPGTLERMGFDRARLEALNPRLVVTSINGFGSSGPYVDRPAFDFIAQAMSGFMSVNGAAGEPPMRAALPISDLIAGLYAAFGTLASLYARDGRGRPEAAQRVETSLVNGLVSFLAYLGAGQLATGEAPERTGNDHPIVYPYGLFRAADGELAVAPSNDRVVRRFLSAIGLEQLLDEERFATNGARLRHRAELGALIDARIGERPQAEWIELLNRAGVPAGKVMSLAEVFEDPQIRAQEMVLEVPHPGRGKVRMTGFPVKLDRTPCALRLPTPELGEHGDAVLAELGYDAAAIARLRDRGVI